MNKKLVIAIAACLIAAIALIIIQRTLSTDKTVKEPATTGKGTAQTGEEGEEEIPTFGFSCADLRDPCYAALEASLRGEVEERGGQLATKDAQGDQNTQNDDILAFADYGVDAIFIVPVSPQGANETLESIKLTQIPVINLASRILDADNVSLYVGTDQMSAGGLIASDLARRCPDGGRLVILESNNRESMIEAVSGFEKGASGHGFEVAARADAGGSRGRAKQEMAAILGKDSHITAIMCANDEMALGVLDALNSYNKDRDPKQRCRPRIYGVGGSPAFKSALSDASSLLTGTAAVTPVSIGQDAAETVFALVAGEEFEEEILEKSYLIDHENIALYGKDGWQ